MDALAAAGLSPDGRVTWGKRIPETGPGVYVVALTADTDANVPVLDACPISGEAVKVLLETRPELSLDGERPAAHALSARVSGFWLPDEVILYIGLAGTSISKRVGQYYRTPLGARKPHAGGWFLKLLSCLDELTVHFAQCDDPDTAESLMLKAFCDGVSEESRMALVDPDHPFPFANLEWPRGTRKRHGILGAKGELGSVLASAGEPTASTTPASRTSGGHVDIEAINDHIQQQLRIRGMDAVAAVEAARWLDEAGLLSDSPHRPGLPLRNLLRERRIRGQRQEPNHRWFIDKVA
jgi:hypothetical protein